MDDLWWRELNEANAIWADEHDADAQERRADARNAG